MLMFEWWTCENLRPALHVEGGRMRMFSKRNVNTGKDGAYKSVAVISEKPLGGRVGSYSVRSVDTGRFFEAKRLAASVLTQKPGKK